MPEAFFWLFSSTTLVAALGVIFSRQAIQSVCWMFALLLSLSGLMAYLGAYLLALITMLVYAGAILVLFAFVIMFIGQRLPRKQVGRWRLMWALMALAAIIIFLLPFAQLATLPQFFAGENSLARTAMYGSELFGRFQLPTEITAWIILWVTVGVFQVIGSTRKEELS